MQGVGLTSSVNGRASYFGIGNDGGAHSAVQGSVRQQDSVTMCMASPPATPGSHLHHAANLFSPNDYDHAGLKELDLQVSLRSIQNSNICSEADGNQEFSWQANGCSLAGVHERRRRRDKAAEELKAQLRGLLDGSKKQNVGADGQGENNPSGVASLSNNSMTKSTRKGTVRSASVEVDCHNCRTQTLANKSGSDGRRLSNCEGSGYPLSETSPEYWRRVYYAKFKSGEMCNGENSISQSSLSNSSVTLAMNNVDAISFASTHLDTNSADVSSFASTQSEHTHSEVSSSESVAQLETVGVLSLDRLHNASAMMQHSDCRPLQDGGGLTLDEGDVAEQAVRRIPASAYPPSPTLSMCSPRHLGVDPSNGMMCPSTQTQCSLPSQVLKNRPSFPPEDLYLDACIERNPDDSVVSLSEVSMHSAPSVALPTSAVIRTVSPVSKCYSGSLSSFDDTADTQTSRRPAPIQTGSWHVDDSGFATPPQPQLRRLPNGDLTGIPLPSPPKRIFRQDTEQGFGGHSPIRKRNFTKPCSDYNVPSGLGSSQGIKPHRISVESDTCSASSLPSLQTQASYSGKPVPRSSSFASSTLLNSPTSSGKRLASPSVARPITLPAAVADKISETSSATTCPSTPPAVSDQLSGVQWRRPSSTDFMTGSVGSSSPQPSRHQWGQQQMSHGSSRIGSPPPLTLSRSPRSAGWKAAETGRVPSPPTNIARNTSGVYDSRCASAGTGQQGSDGSEVEIPVDFAKDPSRVVNAPDILALASTSVMPSRSQYHGPGSAQGSASLDSSAGSAATSVDEAARSKYFLSALGRQGSAGELVGATRGRPLRPPRRPSCAPRVPLASSPMRRSQKSMAPQPTSPRMPLSSPCRSGFSPWRHGGVTPSRSLPHASPVMGCLQACDVDVLRRSWHTEFSKDSECDVCQAVYTRENGEGTKTRFMVVTGIGPLDGAAPIAQFLLSRLQSSVQGCEDTSAGRGKVGMSVRNALGLWFWFQ